MRQVVVGLMSGQGQEGGDRRLQGGVASSGSPAVAPTRNTQDMPTPTVFVSALIVQSPVGQLVYIRTYVRTCVSMYVCTYMLCLQCLWPSTVSV